MVWKDFRYHSVIFLSGLLFFCILHILHVSLFFLDENGVPGMRHRLSESAKRFMGCVKMYMECIKGYEMILKKKQLGDEKAGTSCFWES